LVYVLVLSHAVYLLVFVVCVRAVKMQNLNNRVQRLMLQDCMLKHI